jgi:hypothetical protein
VDRRRNQVYVAEYLGNRVQQFSVFGDFIKVFTDSTTGTGMLSAPRGLGTDQRGNIYVADGTGGGRVVQFNDNGTYLANFSVSGANGIGVDPVSKQIFVGTQSGGTVNRFGSVVGKSDAIGVYRPSTKTFYLRNALTPGAPQITAPIALAETADVALTGDWNADGIDTPALYRPATSTFYLWDRWSELSIATADYAVVFGSPGDRPLVGDWDADGRDGIGVFRPSNGTQYLKQRLLAGTPDYSIGFGLASDIAVAGDWNLDGVSSAGVYRPGDARFRVSNRNTTGAVVEDASYPLGSNGLQPFTGDWTHSGYSALGVFNPASNAFTLKYNLDESAADLVVTFGGDELFHDGFESAGAPGAGELRPVSGVWGSVPE